MTDTVSVAPTWRAWLGLSVMMLPLFMMATDLTVLFLAQPAISAALAPSAVQSLWVVHVGEFFAAGFVLMMGQLSARLGPRRLMLIGVLGYALASTAAAFSGTAEMLILARAMMGLAAATVTPCAISLLRVMFVEPRRFGLAFTIMISAFSAGASLGPPLGGLLLEHFWWGAVFLVNVPAALLLLGLGPVLLPEHRSDSGRWPDPISVALSVVAVMSTVYGLQELAGGSLGVLDFCSIALGVATAVLFARRQGRIPYPLLPLSLFSVARVRASLVLLLLVMALFTGPDVLVGPFLQIVGDLGTAQVGLLLMIPAVVSLPGTMIAPLLVRYMSSATATASSLVVAAIGLAVVVLSTGQVSGVVVGLCLLALGGPAMVLTSQTLVTSAPVERTGTMTAVQDVSTGLGSAIGIAALGGLGAFVFARSLAGLGLPAGVSGANTPGEALALAGTSSAAERDGVVAAVRDAMTTSIEVSFAVGALLAVCCAVLSAATLRVGREDASPAGNS